MIKQQLEHLLQSALKTLQVDGVLPELATPVQIDAAKGKEHGDYASNIALMTAKAAQKKPRDVADMIVKAIPASQYVEKVEIAGPGFINFFLTPEALVSIVPAILTEKQAFGRCKIGREKRVLVEFLSSNPTGPLHVGHGRHAAYGSIVCNLLDAVGFKVFREYYVNDAGRQMDILAVSVWMRYLILCGEAVTFPANGYKGDYVGEIATALKEKVGTNFVKPSQQVLADLPADEPQGGDKELYIDAVIARAKALLGDSDYKTLYDIGLNNILADMKQDLGEFGVHYDKWFSERDFVETGAVDKILKTYDDNGHVFEKDGATWLRTTDYGDDKDRVLVRANGQRTYFGNDVAYHLDKFNRDMDLAIDIFGSDHHGYTQRTKAAVQASGIDGERLLHLLVQFVSLYRGKEQVKMSTRGGEFVTLRELRNEVGNDAARYFYVMRKADQHIDFDLDLAKSKSNENPVFYVQYAHARICSIFKQLAERQMTYDEAEGLKHLVDLTLPCERQLFNTLSKYQDVVISSAIHYEPHVLTNYLRDLATDFHSYYNAEQFIVEESTMRNARLALISAVRQILVNGFSLLGISAPEAM